MITEGCQLRLASGTVATVLRIENRIHENRRRQDGEGDEIVRLPYAVLRIDGQSWDMPIPVRSLESSIAAGQVISL